MSCALYFSRLPFPLLTGLRPSALPPISSTVSSPKRLPTPPLTLLYSVSIPLTTIFVSSGALAVPISLPLLLISSPLAPLAVSSSVTLPIIRDIGVLTSPPIESSSLSFSLPISKSQIINNQKGSESSPSTQQIARSSVPLDEKFSPITSASLPPFAARGPISCGQAQAAVILWWMGAAQLATGGCLV